MSNLLQSLAAAQNSAAYQALNWEGTFSQYLEIARENPRVAQTAYGRIYDMILSFGSEDYTENREPITRYTFFSDPFDNGRDAVYGLDRSLMHLVQIFKSAARGYGTEKRVLLLHGPVGSAKSTIVRLLKKGLEHYSQSEVGALYSFGWEQEDGTLLPCPMNEEPLNLVPAELRPQLERMLNEGWPDEEQIQIRGDLCPMCRFMFREEMKKNSGDWLKVVDKIRVNRVILSEQDRVGIGTFQPKDEKNQDSTELTGDINYRKIAEYGSESDPRCVAGATMLATGEGLRPIGALLPFEMPADTFVPRSLSVSTIGAKIGRADSVYKGGAHTIWNVQTRLGYEISCTGNHQLLSLTPDGEMAWKETRLLQTGDFVALGRGAKVWSETDVAFPLYEAKTYGNERQNPHFPSRMSPELAYFLGLWIGDGHFYINSKTHQYALGWTQRELESLREFLGLLETLFGVKGRITKRHGMEIGIAVGSRRLVSWLQEIVGLKAGARSKEIPTCVLKSSRACVLKYLEGLWKTDGTIRNNGSNWAMFVTCSPVLARQVQQILLALGVVSSRKKVKTACEGYFEVRVYGQNVNRLLEWLPNLSERFTVGSEGRLKAAPNVDIVPFVKPKLRALYRAAFNREELKKRFSGSLHDAKKPNASYGLLRDFLDLVELDDPQSQKIKRDLQHLVEENHLWLPIESAQQTASGEVFDLSVAGTHAYWADGFVCHNCFNFDGEFNIANRGLVEFVEVLKLDVAFLYDLLGASQEHKIKPKRFPQTDIDEVIIGHTNSPEYKKLQNNEFMEALRDRTVKVDIPYNTRLADEIRIYERDYNSKRIKGKHIAPHTLQIAAMWAVLTRLEEPNKADLTLLQKLKLYDGKSLPGYTEDNIRELRSQAKNEGMEGISPRYVQDKISNALVSESGGTSINPFMVLNELEDGLKHHSLINSEETKKRYRELFAIVKSEYDDIVKSEVQRAIAADEDALKRLSSNYIDNVNAYVSREKVKNKFTGADENPDERLMRSIEEKIDIPESRKDDFRREIMNYIGSLALQSKVFQFDSNPRLHKALELKLFEDQKDSIKLTSIVSNVVDKDTQEKIEVVKTRLIKEFGYDEQSANDVLQYVASIFARGDVRK